MKVVKVGRRWKLYEQGFPVAIRFESWADCRDSKIEDWLRTNRGYEYAQHSQWKSHWGTSTKLTSAGHSSRPYFIGLRTEADVTVVLLALS